MAPFHLLAFSPLYPHLPAQSIDFILKIFTFLPYSIWI